MNIDFSFVPKHYAARTDEKMREVLMNPESAGPEIHYYMIRGGVDQKNITIWEPGTISDEYIKTYGHYHVGDLDETYWILFGDGIALLQKLATDKEGNFVDDIVEEFKAVPVKAGDSIYMPKGYGHLCVNVGDTYFVTADNSPVNFGDKDPSGMPGHADYESVRRMHGFAYYVVENKGKPVLKANPRYKQILKTEFSGIPVVK